MIAIDSLFAEIRSYATLTWLLPFVMILLVLSFVERYLYCIRPRQGTLEWIHAAARKPIHFPKRHRCDKKDVLPILILTAVYAFTALFQLGDNVAPQTFHQFQKEEPAVVSFAEPVTLDRMMYYTGLYTGEYAVTVITEEGSQLIPQKLEQPHSKLFHWRELTLQEPIEGVIAIEISASRLMELGELRPFIAGTDELMPTTAYSCNFSELVDEPETVPLKSHWTNSTYFDEIYHARTAYEHINNVYPYEITHPPLGKLLISLGIRLFGMTPFGWRIVGTLFGIGMVPIFYVFVKNLFGKRKLAVIGTTLFCTSFMHLTQTRIATIDTYAVFFILLMYYFMYRYLTLPQDAKFGVQMRELGLCGLFFGIGIACKWTVLYGGAGLAILYFVGMYFRYRDWDIEQRKGRFAPWCVGTLAMSVVFFILIPAVIYCLSYLPYLWASDGSKSLLQIVWDNQVSMFTYHAGVTEEHSYQSQWWKWVLDIRPILYYLDNSKVVDYGVKTAFAAFNNPLISWAGLFAVIICGVRTIRAKSGAALFLAVGYLAQLVPWMPISRPTFAYHYFPSIPFLILAICYLFNEMLETRGEKIYRLGYAFAGTSAGLYAAFYPVLIGLEAPVWYTTNLLKWLPSWPF